MRKEHSQASLSHALAGDVSLNLGLVSSVYIGPKKCSSNGNSPKSVPPQRVCVKADETEKVKGHRSQRFALNELTFTGTLVSRSDLIQSQHSLQEVHSPSMLCV